MKSVLRLLVAAGFAGCSATPAPPPILETGSIARAVVSKTLRPHLDHAAVRIDQSVDRNRLEATLRRLTERPQVAGSVADHDNALWLHEQFEAAGLRSRIEEFHVLLPMPVEMSVEMQRPGAHRASLTELPIDGDPDTLALDVLPPFLAYAADGDVTAPLIYVHRADEDDFRALRDLGVDLERAIGIARYGGLYRGNKVKNAAKAGLSGLLIYSDPADDGEGKGPVYPAGPWRSPSSVQRGSVLDIAFEPGDPLTRGRPALIDAPRTPLGDAPALPRIPAVALSAADARPFLESLGGRAAPKGWTTGHGFPLKTGSDRRTQVRLRLKSDWAVRPIWNVIAEIRGTIDPGACVILGSHRDAWVHGAVDPSSGTATLLEAARVLGALAAEGLRPARTIRFCSWDGEEFGILGSTEHVEAAREHLHATAIAYINCDAAVSGPKLGVTTSPELAAVAREVLDSLPDQQKPGKTLADATEISSSGFPGGGSDFVAFEHLLAIPIAIVGSSGSYGSYHSLHDTFGWMKKFGDPEFQSHARVAKILALLAHQLADSTFLPYDVAALASAVRRELSALATRHPGFDATSLQNAIDDVEAASARVDGFLARSAAADPDPTSLVATNRSLLQSFRALLSDQLLPDRPFYRNVLVAVDGASGYGALPLPGLATALDSGKSGGITAQAANELERRLRALAHHLNALVPAVATAPRR